MNLNPFLGKPLLSPCLLFVAFITFTTIFSGHNLIYILKHQFDHTQQEIEQPKQQHPRSEKEKDVTLPFSGGEIGGGCNIFEGRWVFEKESRPLYDEGELPYIQPQLACLAYGRPDKEYQQRRWQPHSCSLPRIVQIPQELEWFKDFPMYVKYVTEEAATESSKESGGVFNLASLDLESSYCCTWNIADVRKNREQAGRGRPLSRKQRERQF